MPIGVGASTVIDSLEKYVLDGSCLIDAEYLTFKNIILRIFCQTFHLHLLLHHHLPLYVNVISQIWTKEHDISRCASLNDSACSISCRNTRIRRVYNFLGIKFLPVLKMSALMILKVTTSVECSGTMLADKGTTPHMLSNVDLQVTSLCILLVTTWMRALIVLLVLVQVDSIDVLYESGPAGVLLFTKPALKVFL